jgi:hypothetical protein
MKLRNAISLAIALIGLYIGLGIMFFGGFVIVMKSHNDGVIMILALVEMVASIPFILLSFKTAQRI